MKNSETVMLRVGKHAHDGLFDVANALENEYGRRVTASDAIEILVARAKGQSDVVPTGKQFRLRKPGRPAKFYGDEERTPREGMRAMRKMREGFGLQHVVAAFTMNFYSRRSLIWKRCYKLSVVLRQNYGAIKKPRGSSSNL